MLNPLSVLKHPVLVSLYFIASLAHAQNFSTAASDGMGGAGRAAVEAGDVNYLNPAGLVHLKGRFISATASKEDLSLSLSEASREVMIPGAFSYLQRKDKTLLGQTVRWQDTRLSLADFVTTKFSMGVTGIINTVIIQDKSYRQTNSNLGFFYTPSQSLGLAAVFYNLFGVNEKVPKEWRMPPETGFGLNYIYQNFLRYRFDVKSASNNNFGRATYMTGFETLLNQWMSLRLGYQNEHLARRELGTAGVGFYGPMFLMNYAYQKSIKGANFDRHSIDLSFSF